jgi:ankyrin repeat protein
MTDEEMSSLLGAEENGNTLLMAAAAVKSKAITELLVNKGADKAIANPHGITALHVAVLKNSVQVVETLTNGAPASILNQVITPRAVDTTAWADPTSNNRKIVDLKGSANLTPLMLAVRFQSADVISPLTAAGADIGIKHGDGWTALHYATKMGYIKGIRSLAEGASQAILNMRDAHMATALMIAANEGHHEAVAILMRAKCDFKIQDVKGRTALYIAVENGNAEAMRRLLEDAGKSALEIADKEGNTPYLAAAIFGHYMILSELASAGADQGKTNNDGQTAAAIKLAQAGSAVSDGLKSLKSGIGSALGL